MSPKDLKFWRFVAETSFVVTGGFLVSIWVLSMHYMREPLTPDPSSGNIVAWDNHGTTHYITLGEDRLLEVLVALSLASFICTIASALAWKYRQSKNRLRSE
jgi:hypothetical protein